MKKRPDPSRNKQERLIKVITKLAHELGPGAKLPTIQSFSEKYNVTLTTLDRAWIKLENQGVITRRQGSGTYVSEDLYKKRIGLIFGQSIFRFGYSSYYQLLLHHCQHLAESSDDEFSFYMSLANKGKKGKDGFNQELKKALESSSLDGLLVFEVYIKEHQEWLKSFNTPTISQSGSEYFPSMMHDNNQMIRLGVKALAEKGCQSIGLFGVIREHVDVFRRAAKKYKVSVQESAVFAPDENVIPAFKAHEPLGRDWMEACIRQCGGKTNLPDGILITDDMVTRGACLYMSENGLRLGKHVKIASHANEGSLVLEYWKDHLLLLEFSAKELVDEMFRKLKKAMDGEEIQRKKQLLKARLRPAK